MAWKDLITWNRKKQQQIHPEHPHPIAGIRREVNRLFDDFYRGFGRVPALPYGEEELFGFSPKVNVSENDKEIEVSVEVPGMEQNDVDITLRDDMLMIRGEKKQEKEEKDKEYYYVERSYGSFCRTLQLPCEVDREKVNASYKKGVLRINLPKSEEIKENVRKIEVKVND